MGFNIEFFLSLSLSLSLSHFQTVGAHYLGQKFAKSFDIKFLNEKNKHEFVYMACYGVSTRLSAASLRCVCVCVCVCVYIWVSCLFVCECVCVCMGVWFGISVSMHVYVILLSFLVMPAMMLS